MIYTSEEPLFSTARNAKYQNLSVESRVNKRTGLKAAMAPWDLLFCSRPDEKLGWDVLHTHHGKMRIYAMSFVVG
jgi:hypothetical protein